MTSEKILCRILFPIKEKKPPAFPTKTKEKKDNMERRRARINRVRQRMELQRSLREEMKTESPPEASSSSHQPRAQLNLYPTTKRPYSDCALGVPDPHASTSAVDPSAVGPSAVDTRDTRPSTDTNEFQPPEPSSSSSQPLRRPRRPNYRDARLGRLPQDLDQEVERKLWFTPAFFPIPEYGPRRSHLEPEKLSEMESIFDVRDAIRARLKQERNRAGEEEFPDPYAASAKFRRKWEDSVARWVKKYYESFFFQAGPPHPPPQKKNLKRRFFSTPLFRWLLTQSGPPLTNFLEESWERAFGVPMDYRTHFHGDWELLSLKLVEKFCRQGI